MFQLAMRTCRGYRGHDVAMSEDDLRGQPDHPDGLDEDHGRPSGERRYDRPGVKAGTWVNRAVLVLVLIALAYVAYAVSAAFFPRWWAHRVGDQVQGRLTAGTLWGLFYGFVFTLVPLLLIAQMRRRFLTWTWRFIVLAVAVLLATPNWLTLSVVVGNSKAAHAGERIFDVDAPGFRVATAFGAIGGAVVALALVAASMRLAGRRRQVRDLKGQLSDRERAEREREEAERETEDRD
jgi:signal transduction histidine kinase